MKRRHYLLAHTVVLAILAMASQASASTIDLILLPSDGAVSGPPGSIVGWGYSITNNSLTDWFRTTALNSDSFSNGSPVLLFDFPIVAPGATVSVPFDSGTGAGLYELIWDVGAPAGFVNSGNFVLSGEWWDGDPLNGGNFLFSEPDISLPYSATVTEEGPGTTEPSTWWLCLGVLVPAAFGRLRRAHRMCALCPSTRTP